MLLHAQAPLFSARSRTSQRSASRVCCQPVVAGWFDNFGASSDAKRDAEFARQQEVLAARRRGGKAGESAVEKRRAEVARYMKLSKAEQRKYREQNPDNQGPIYGAEPKLIGESKIPFLPTIFLPVAPFGDPKMDGGERWDLKAAYTDEGYEDPDADVMGKLARFFGGGKKQ